MNAAVEDVLIEYIAEPTARIFHNSPAFVRAMMGPIGSGKTVACVQEILRIGMLQEPQRDGIRRTRWAVIRNTFPELKSTTIKTFLDWFEPISSIIYSVPITAIIQFGDVWIEVFFIALDKPKDVKKLKSLELTGIFINESSEIPKEVLDMATGRVARYPAKRDGGAVRSCVILDTNPPDDDHWLYRMFEEELPDTYELFKQPPALLRLQGKNGPIYLPNPAAENVKHQQLGYKYWLNLIPGKAKEWINVFVMGMYGSSHAGRPCYPSYNDSVHCSSKPLEVYKTVPLLLGWDYGRTPVCIIGQMAPSGQFRILDEIIVDVDGPGMGIRKFVRDVVKPYLTQHYAGHDAVYSWGDPSGISKDSGEQSLFDIQGEEGIPTESALSNDIPYRLENVDYFLLRMVDGEPGLLLDPKCRIVRKGFLGGYRFERVQVVGGGYKDKPNKNRYSHPHDSVQYLADLAKNGIVTMTDRTVATEVHTGINPDGWT